MTAPTRIYLVTPATTSRLRPARPVLVEATHPNAALKTVTEGLFAVSVPSQLEIVRMMQSGLRVVSAGERMYSVRDDAMDDVSPLSLATEDAP